MSKLAEQIAPIAIVREGACLCCGTETEDWIDMPVDPMRRVETSFGHTVRCRACGLGSVSPLPHRDRIAAFYDLPTYYTHGGSQAVMTPDLLDRAITKVAWWRDASEQLDPAVLASRLPSTAVICDLGCGLAEHLVAFKALGFAVVGVDPDPVAREIAARNGVTVLDGTADDPPPTLEDGSFDLVIMTHALEHCLDPKAALATCARILKPGGVLYCEVPNCACTHFVELRECSTMFDAPRHLHFFEPRTLRRMLADAGLACFDEFYSGFARQHAREWRAREADIARQVRDAVPGRRPRVHGLWYTLSLLRRTAFASREAKYDSFGIFARLGGEMPPLPVREGSRDA